jgi:hypothetical protein
MRLPPSQHHTGLLSTQARKPATAGGTGNSTSTTSSGPRRKRPRCSAPTRSADAKPQ